MASFNPLVHNPEQSRVLFESLRNHPISTGQLHRLQDRSVMLSRRIGSYTPASFEGVSMLGMYDWNATVTDKDVAVNVKNFAESTGGYYSREYLWMHETDQEPHVVYALETSRFITGPSDLDLNIAAHRRMIRIANRVVDRALATLL